MKSNGARVQVGDVISGEGTVISFHPDDPSWKRRTTIQRKDGSIRETTLTQADRLNVIGGPTLVRARELGTDSISVIFGGVAPPAKARVKA